MSNTATKPLQMQQGSADRFVHFGSFEVDLRERKLNKAGSRIRLQEQPFRILVLLLERPGQLVTREEIRQRLWPQDVYVDFDAALNTAIRKLRDALNDSAESPRYLETVPRQGYRFVAPVAWRPEPLGAIPTSSRIRPLTYALVVAALVLAGSSVLAVWHYRGLRSQITPDDSIVLADFANNTGDEIFDDTLSTALKLSLRQSPYFKVLPDSDVRRILQQMTRPAGTKLTGELTRELCQRARSKVYIGGSIATLGSKYVLGLKAVNCQNGDTLAQEQVVAASKEKILDALSDAASRLRGELGESLASLQKFDVPLANATTSSLDALKAYSVALKVFAGKGPADSIPYFRRAVEVDPNFAVAYRGLGLDYSALGETERAAEYYGKAFQFRDHVSKWEKLAITADYYLNVTGELDKAAGSYQQWIESFPGDDGAYSTLGIVYAMQGEYEKASEITSRALQIAPSFGSYLNLANYSLALQRFDEAGRIISEAQARKMDAAQIHSALYALAFLNSDSAAIAEQQKWFVGKPEEASGQALASDTEAYRGHLRKARELTKQAVESALRNGDKESGAISLANAAVERAAYGRAVEARQMAIEALKLSPKSQGAEVEAALAFAMAGNASRAKSLVRDLRKRFPLDTQMQLLWLPAIEMQLALDSKNLSYILNDPAPSTSIEFGAILFTTNASCLYPVYVRGESYLAAAQGNAAAAEFQKILDHNGIVWNCWTGALARLGVARANALEARTLQGVDADAARNRALAAYRDFLALWKDADSDIPILQQAKSEYAKLQ